MMPEVYDHDDEQGLHGLFAAHHDLDNPLLFRKTALKMFPESGLKMNKFSDFSKKSEENPINCSNTEINRKHIHKDNTPHMVFRSTGTDSDGKISADDILLQILRSNSRMTRVQMCQKHEFVELLIMDKTGGTRMYLQEADL